MENINCSKCKISFLPSKKIIKRCDTCRTKYHCQHKRERSRCVDCNGSEICEHIRIRSTCVECDGSQICQHKKQRSRCVDCDGSQICQHKKRRSDCITCTPKNACQSCFQVFVDVRYRFHPYCFRCFCVLNPDADIPRKFKLKEHYLRDFLKETYPEINMIFDKALESKRRPDVLIRNSNYNIVIECDENQHNNYECENLRICQIFSDLNNLPIFIIRFNPDNYSTDEEKFSSCFKTTRTGQLSLNKNEWKRRTRLLKEKIDTIINLKNVDKEMNIVFMFYSV